MRSKGENAEALLLALVKINEGKIRINVVKVVVGQSVWFGWLGENYDVGKQR